MQLTAPESGLQMRFLATFQLWAKVRNSQSFSIFADRHEAVTQFWTPMAALKYMDPALIAKLVSLQDGHIYYITVKGSEPSILFNESRPLAQTR